MNFFGKNKKTKEHEGSLAQSEPPVKQSKTLKRKQKNAVIEKPQFDLSTALPASNDFRTSLMLPGLSARFSMLREQDDPSSKLGKASDDSVLFPKRQSRLNVFNHVPLTDIAEVESIYSFKAPFAEGARSSSVLDDYNSDDGSGVMSRSRPIDGNNLFGGRQKVFKVATKTENNPASNGGRYLYNNDVPTSLWQQHRLKTRLAQEAEDEPRRDSSQSQEPDHDDTESAGSPATAFSNNRGTTSSTNSGPSNRRTSTAATSVVSESPLTRQSTSISKKSFTIGDDASSPLTKSFGVGRPPMPSKTMNRLSQSKSATNLSERFVRSNSVFTSPLAFRAASPVPEVTSPSSLNFNLTKENSRSGSGTEKYRAASPESQDVQTDEMMTYVQPNDRGKATALGLFNRPQQQYNEEQFSQRQKQIQKGRSSPTSTSSRSESRVSPEPVKPLESRESSDIPSKTSSRVHSDSLPIAQNWVRESVPSSVQAEATRISTTSSRFSGASRPRKHSSAANSAVGAAAVRSRVENLIQRQNAELIAEEQQPQKITPTTDSAKAMSTTSDRAKAAPSRTFFSSFDASDDESMEESELTDSRTSEEQDDQTNVHPALRSPLLDFDFGTEVSGLKISNLLSDDSSLQSPTTPTVMTFKEPDMHKDAADSPTLGPNPGLGLSGLVRAHLRNDSDRSTLPPSPTVKPAFLRPREISVASTARTTNPPESLRSDPWELERPQQHQPSPKITPPTPSPTTVMSQRAQQILEQAKMHRENAQITSDVNGGEFEGQTEQGSKSWQDELTPSHQRGESTETTKEREEFDREMAERRRRIQEKLKNSAATQIRSQSPSMGHDLTHLPSQALSALKHKASKNTVRPAEQSNAKAMRMLGLQPQPPAQTHTMETFHDDQPVQPPYARPHSPRSPNMGSDYESDRHMPKERGEQFDRNMARSATPSGGRGPRPRGYSTTQDRSRSRNGQYRDEHAMAADRSRSRTGQYRDEIPPEHRGRAPGQSRSPPDHRQPSRGPDNRSASAMSGRYRSTSRPAPSHGYYDPRQPQSEIFHDPRSPPQPQTQTFFESRSPSLMSPNSSSPSAFGPPRPSPRPGQNYPPSPAPTSALPSPFLVDANNGRSTPTFNGRSTPQPSQTRKRSVTKGMISEPTFLSSTSSVPLLNRNDSAVLETALASPPIPAMNPRRRGNTFSQTPNSPPLSSPYSPNPSSAQARVLLPATPESPVDPSYFGKLTAPPSNALAPPPPSTGNTTNMRLGVGTGKPPPKPRNKLRKISSEGGGMAAKARYQAQAMERGTENGRSPMVPVFPNRSATSLSMARDDGMF